MILADYREFVGPQQATLYLNLNAWGNQNENLKENLPIGTSKWST